MIKTIAISITTLIFMASPVFAGDFMSADEVKALISGKTTYGKGLKKDFTVVTYFAADGTMDGTKDGNRRKGKWSVKGNGKQCVEFDDGKNNCRYIKDNGDGTYSKVKVKGSGKEIPTVLWESIKDGNTVQ
jgi:Zn/Cd-binding protein ZinT